MDDFEDLPLETSSGARPSTTVGDRLLVALAGVALVGGLMIAAGNLLAGLVDEPVARASSEPAATVRPTATPRPTPTARPLRELGLVPGRPPDQPDDEFLVHRAYWLEATRPTPVHVAPRDDAAESSSLRAGQVTLAESRPDTGGEREWLYVYDPQPGWVRAWSRAGEPLVRLVETATGASHGGVNAMAAGPTGFVLHGFEPQSPGWLPPAAVVATSPDGERWSPGEPTSWNGWQGAAMAWGPSGWLAATTTWGSSPPSTWIWESGDGSRWTPLGSLESTGSEYVRALIGADHGYLLVLASNEPSGESLWFSPDGLTWQEGRAPFPDGASVEWGEIRVLPAGSRLVAWTFTEGLAELAVAVSQTGRSWTPISTEGTGERLELAVVGEELLGVSRDANGFVRAWRAVLSDDAPRLVQDHVLAVAFYGAVITSVVSDGSSALAFGYEREGTIPVVWRYTASAWRKSPGPTEGFGVPVQRAVIGPLGAVAVGGEIVGRGANPVLWHLGPDGAWAREAARVIPPVAAPAIETCGKPPESAMDFMALDPLEAITCYGDRPLTLTAWSAACRECWTDTELVRQPDWFSERARGLFLMPMQSRSDTQAWWRSAVLHPTLEPQVAWRDAWVRITGHFDDPSARDCRRNPTHA
ncbi:MAG TPA: hypothetical protein VHK63_06780, partial [Candidatus Limnocylindria bacterium]|nr:hypothetical protein [Candidatus Limnocylindria bacterium]